MLRFIRNFLLPAILLGAGLAVFGVLMASKEPPKRIEQKVSIPRVDVSRVASAPPGGFGIEVHGTVVPKRDIVISAEVQGRVVEKTDRCWAGRQVRRGEILMRIDPRSLDFQRQTLEAELAQIDADLKQLEVEIANNHDLIELAEENVELRRREQRRVQQLITQNASSVSEIDQADAQVLTARQSLQQLLNEKRTFEARRGSLEAQRRRANAQLDQVLYDLSRTTIVSPVEGIISEVLVEQDGYVRAGDSLVKIDETTTMEVRCSLQMEDLYWLAGGNDPLELASRAADDPYRIPHCRAEVSHSLAGETNRWDGVLARYEGGGIDERTRTVPCRVEVPDPDGLRRGMFVSVTLFADDPNVPLVTIPRAGFRPNHEVWLVEDGRLRIRRVEPVRVLDETVLIRGDGPGKPIEPGDLLIVSPLESPVDAMAVEFVDPVTGTPASGSAAVAARDDDAITRGR